MGLAQAVSNLRSVNRAVNMPKYSSHIKKTYVIRWIGGSECNGKVVYEDENGLYMGDFDKAFDEEIEGYNPPIFGEIEEMEMTVKEYTKWLKERYF